MNWEPSHCGCGAASIEARDCRMSRYPPHPPAAGTREICPAPPRSAMGAHADQRVFSAPSGAAVAPKTLFWSRSSPSSAPTGGEGSHLTVLSGAGRLGNVAPRSGEMGT